MTDPDLTPDPASKRGRIELRVILVVVVAVIVAGILYRVFLDHPSGQDQTWRPSPPHPNVSNPAPASGTR